MLDGNPPDSLQCKLSIYLFADPDRQVLGHATSSLALLSIEVAALRCIGYLQKLPNYTPSNGHGFGG
jgi:hypothetical protein